MSTEKIALNTKFHKYDSFLTTLTNQLSKERDRLQASINLNNAIQDIILKKSSHKRVSINEYKNLAKYGCPNFALKAVFDGYSDLNEYSSAIPAVDDEKYDDCYTINSCGECWQHYINSFADSINDSSISVKNLKFDGRGE